MITVKNFFILYNKYEGGFIVKKKRKCQIQSEVTIICPVCNNIIYLPMNQVVNGEEVLCPNCQNQVAFIK